MIEILLTVFYIVVCVLMFSLAVLIHEFGHFIVAIRLGLRVEAFSLGFGPVLWKRKVNGVEYRISALPLGGYVSLPDIDPEGTKALEGGAKAETPPPKPIKPWQELLVALAGPLMNVVLAVVLAVLLACLPQARFGELKAVIGEVPPDGPAAAAGLRAGDRVVSVGGRPVSTWTEMQTEVQISGGRATDFVVERPGAAGAAAETLTLAVTPKRHEASGAWYILALSVTNESGAVAWMPARNPLRQLAWDMGSIFRVLKGLVTPKEAKATSQALGGPVMIAEGLYRQVRRDPVDALGFLRFLNSNLAVLNLLPIPVLDGGLIVFALIALVFRRRVPAAVVKSLSMVFMVLLLGLMGLLIFRDGVRSWKMHAVASGDTGGSEVSRASSDSSVSGASRTSSDSSVSRASRASRTSSDSRALSEQPDSGSENEKSNATGQGR